MPLNGSNKPATIALQCCGGLQISLDLSAAFDLVRWDHLKTATDLAGTPSHLQEVLLTWLVQVRYIFHHRGETGCLTPHWGLRQGCSGSPLLWSAFTSLLCVTLDAQLGTGWAAQHATLYADDSHLCWCFMSHPQLTQSIAEAKAAFQIFRTFHMRTNVAKTKAILKAVGTLRSRVHKEYVRTNTSNQTRRLLLSPRDPEPWIPLVSQTEYLGLIICYGSFETQSLRHRVAKANARRWAMASAACSRSPASLRECTSGVVVC